MTHIWQGVQSGQWLTPQARRALIRMPLCVVLPAIYAFTLRRAAKHRAASAAAAAARIAQA
jgi:hypothetical protein